MMQAKNKIVFVSFWAEGDAKSVSSCLLDRAIALFCKEKGLEPQQVLRDEGGKPYFPHLPYHLSVTHTRNLFVAVFAPFPIGVDAEPESERRQRLSSRYFDSTEQKEVFSRVWTAKEAVGKLTGRGLSDALRTRVLPELATLDGRRYALLHHRLSSPEGEAFLVTVAFEDEKNLS